MSREASGSRSTGELPVLFVDDFIAVVDKPAGIPTERTRDPLREHVLSRARAVLGLPPDAFLSAPHRLDRDTSGALLLARSPEVLAALNADFRQRRVHKEYVAVVHGSPAADTWRCETFLAPVGRRGGIEVWGSVRAGGRKAITSFRVLERGEVSRIACVLETGRTHQARVHAAESGYPIAGDALYGAPEREHQELGRHLLHAARLEFVHPTQGVSMDVAAPVPELFRRFVRQRAQRR